MPWDTYDAEALIAGLKFAEEVGPCPACGEASIVEVIDVQEFGGPSKFLPGTIHCSADCYEEDPQRYLDAVKTWKAQRDT